MMPIRVVQNTRTSRTTTLILFYACLLVCMPILSLIDQHLEVAQKVAIFPICGLWRKSVLTNAPTVYAVKAHKIM